MGVAWWWFRGGVRVVQELGWVGVVVGWGGVGWHQGWHSAFRGRGRACTSLIQYI